MKTRNTWLALLALALLVTLPLAAAAGPLEDAKRAGHIGEKFDGYLAVVDSSAPASAASLVKSINDKRKAKYAEVAAGNGLEVSQVAAVSGEKLLGRAKPGEFVMQKGKGWEKR